MATSPFASRERRLLAEAGVVDSERETKEAGTSSWRSTTAYTVVVFSLDALLVSVLLVLITLLSEDEKLRDSEVSLPAVSCACLLSRRSWSEAERRRR